MGNLRVPQTFKTPTLMAEENKIILDADVKPLKKQLRDATLELQAARAKFGELSEEAVLAAQNVANIRDEIQGANEAAQIFDPGARFQALTNAAGAAAGGIAAAQGALALFGGESEDVEKALLKVQSAMALSQGLSQLKDIGKVGDDLILSFRGLTAGANGFKKALISTGIGALVIAVGLLVAYWEDIVALVGGVSKEQDALNASTQKDLQANQEKLEAIDGQANQLKLQGKTEEEILELKMAQTTESIRLAEVNLQNAKATKAAQVEAAQRNKTILEGLIRILTVPIQAVLASIDLIGKAAGQEFNLMEKFTGGLAELVFDPEAVAEKGDASIKEAEGVLNGLKEKQAGYELSVLDSQKAAGEKASAEREKQAKAEEEAFAILQEAKNKMLDKQAQEELAIIESYKAKQLKLDEAGIKDDGSLEAIKQEELKAVREKYDKEEADRKKAFQEQLNEITTATRLQGIADENEKAREQIQLDFEKQREDILSNDRITSEEKTALLLALKNQEVLALNDLQLAIDEANAIKELEKLDAEMIKAENDLAMQRSILEEKDILLKEYYDKGLISDQEYTEGIKANTDARIAIDKAEYDLKISQAQAASALLGALSELAGKRTAAGKALGIAEALINTSVGVTQALKQESVLPSPFDVVAKVANVATILAAGFKAVKSITAVNVPGGGGGGGGVSLPSISASAPSGGAEVPTVGNSPVTALGTMMTNQPPIRAYVVESEVTGTQKRVADIERRAGF